MRRIAGLTIVLFATLTGCGGGERSYQEILGCTKVTSVGTSELLAQDRLDCVTDDGVIKVYTFANSTKRDNWRAIAEGFGAGITHQGETWVAVDY